MFSSLAPAALNFLLSCTCTASLSRLNYCHQETKIINLASFCRCLNYCSVEVEAYEACNNAKDGDIV